ncbi:MAG TPA: TolC family protein [Candidatus Angelobacter sp.]|jgi:outer membrane protein TolC|nr:TolC family protein [Candidatus Angelobacter sp.]
MKAFYLLFLFAGAVCAAQDPMPQGPAVPLATLVEEAQQKNPEIQAATHGAQAAGHAASRTGALPDTQIMLQHLSVGSPRLFAGYTNSDFAYIGLGASQEFPWPGKRALRMQVADAQADAMLTQSGAVSRMVIEQVKIAYFKLAYLQATFEILLRDDKLLGEMEQIAESRYRVGQGNQQEVLKAQLQHTRILQEINMHHREQGQLQAQIKQLLARAQDSPDIVTDPLRERSLPQSASELLQQARQKNPEINAREQLVKRADLQTELARKEFRPDFGLQYLYQNTDRKFRDYYMLTFTVTLPNRGRRRAELAEAAANRQSAAAELNAEVQRRQAEVQDQYVMARTSAEQLRIFREGLMPQSEAAFRAAMAAYQANRQDFETLLSSFRDSLDFEEQYQKELSEHESALARLESLTGVTLP